MFGITRAPEIARSGLQWFNVEHPLNLKELRGRLVILDFWTFCCINCFHMLSTLRKVEQRFGSEVVVIGIHSPKFTAERDPLNLGHAIARYNIKHPVVHDPQMVLWDEYAVKAWPTIVLITPEGHVIGHIPGEPNPDLFLTGIAGMLEMWRNEGLLRPKVETATVLRPLCDRLCFPGKIKPMGDWRGKRCWAVADSGHHAISVIDAEANELLRFGDGAEGFRDGDAASARFSMPQGLACHNGHIFVADTGNHAIRRIDLDKKAVTTLAGDGRRGIDLSEGVGGLASVWDMETDGKALYFANAGTHQIGAFDLVRNEIALVAGTCGENRVDGPADQALLAQPSGLTLDRKNRILYFTDSETSSVRALYLAKSPEVKTLAGGGLFNFGHVDGTFEESRFQHPLGLALNEEADQILVADSYNNRVRVLDLATKTVKSFDEQLFDCESVPIRTMCEPAGICLGPKGTMLVSDTNNHRIVQIDLASKTARTWFR